MTPRVLVTGLLAGAENEPIVRSGATLIFSLDLTVP
jgi:hypothetical protein